MKVLRARARVCVCVCVCVWGGGVWVYVCKHSVISNAGLRAIERTTSLLQRGRRCHIPALRNTLRITFSGRIRLHVHVRLYSCLVSLFVYRSTLVV